MDPVTAAATAAAVMRYVLPAIRLLGDKVLDASADSAGDAAVGFGVNILRTLLARRGQVDRSRPDISVLEASIERRVHTVARDPEQQKASSQLEGAIEELLMADPDLRASIAAQLSRAPVEIRDDHSVHFGGDNRGMIFTGPMTGNPSITNNFAPAGASQGERLLAARKYLGLGLPGKALEELASASDASFPNPDVYYLSAVATLDRKKAFFATLADIRRVQGLLDAAMQLDDRGIFHYFGAYLAVDFYDRNSLRAPRPASSSLADAVARGVTPAEVVDLFHMLGVSNPLPIPR